MYTKLDDRPGTGVQENTQTKEPCLCSCKTPFSKDDLTIVDAEQAALSVSVNYDINGLRPSDNT